MCVFWCSLNLAHLPITNVSTIASSRSLVAFVINHFAIRVIWMHTNVLTVVNVRDRISVMFCRQMILNVYTTVTHVNRCTEIPSLMKHTLLTNHMNVMCVIKHLDISADLSVTKMPSMLASNGSCVTFVIKRFPVRIVWMHTDLFTTMKDRTHVT